MYFCNTKLCVNMQWNYYLSNRSFSNWSLHSLSCDDLKISVFSGCFEENSHSREDSKSSFVYLINHLLQAKTCLSNSYRTSILNTYNAVFLIISLQDNKDSRGSWLIENTRAKTIKEKELKRLIIMFDITFKVLKITVDTKRSQKWVPQASSTREEIISIKLTLISFTFKCYTLGPCLQSCTALKLMKSTYNRRFIT